MWDRDVGYKCGIQILVFRIKKNFKDIEKVFLQVKLYTVASKVYELDDKEVGKVIIHPTPLSGKVR